jgi:hypothetical protein
LIKWILPAGWLPFGKIWLLSSFGQINNWSQRGSTGSEIIMVRGSGELLRLWGWNVSLMMRGATLQWIAVAWGEMNNTSPSRASGPRGFLSPYASACERQSWSLCCNTIYVYCDNEIKKIIVVVFHNGNNFIDPSAESIIIQSVWFVNITFTINAYSVSLHAQLYAY